MDLLAALDRTYDAAARIIGNVRDDQWSAPTPCEEWDVRQVVEHVTGTVIVFTNGLAGQGATPSGDDPAALFRDAARENLAAWKAPGAMETTLQLPWGETPAAMAINVNLIDVFQHAWDVARATGQSTDALDPAVAEHGLGFTGKMIAQMGRGGAFGEEQPCHDGASAADRLAAFLGRKP